MSKPIGWVAGAMLSLASIGIIQPAGATSLIVGSALTLDGLNIEVIGCQYVFQGGTQTNCGLGASAFEFIPDGAGASIRIQGASSAPLFSVAARTGYTDLTVQFNVSAATPSAKIDKVGLAMAGSITNQTTTPLTRIRVGESSTSFSTMNVNALPNYTSDSRSFTALSSLNVIKDIEIQAGGVATGETLILSYVTQRFVPAPEPASVGAFLIGLAGLGTMRWRRRPDGQTRRCTLPPSADIAA